MYVQFVNFFSLRLRIQEHKCHARYLRIILQKSSFKVVFRDNYSKIVKDKCSHRSKTLSFLCKFYIEIKHYKMLFVE